jgi:hypothetical protein
MKQVNMIALLLVLSLLIATTNADYCSTGSTRDSGCQDCVDSTPDSDCNYCYSGYYKFSAKACKKCPSGTGRGSPNQAVLIETDAVCLKCAPQLKCETCQDSPYYCSSCAAGSYRESGKIGQLSVTGCSTNCSEFSTYSYLPENSTYTYCENCDSNCKKCEVVTNMKQYASFSLRNRTGKCIEANEGFYLLPNTSDATMVPGVRSCGANCKKCTDRTNCAECLSGWAKGATDKGECTSPISAASSSSIAQVLFLLTSLASICW